MEIISKMVKTEQSHLCDANHRLTSESVFSQDRNGGRGKSLASDLDRMNQVCPTPWVQPPTTVLLVKGGCAHRMARTLVTPALEVKMHRASEKEAPGEHLPPFSRSLPGRLRCQSQDRVHRTTPVRHPAGP